MGLDALGVPSPTSDLTLRTRTGFMAREFVARNLAVLDRWFPPDTMLGPREATPDDPEHQP